MTVVMVMLALFLTTTAIRVTAKAAALAATAAMAGIRITTAPVTATQGRDQTNQARCTDEKSKHGDVPPVDEKEHHHRL
jgi:hypothetical protein